MNSTPSGTTGDAATAPPALPESGFPTPRFLPNLAERTVATHFKAFLGLLLAGTVTDLSTAKAAAVSALPAALAIVKGTLSGVLGRTGTASLLPTPKARTAPPTGPAAS
ncbi:hypothetical protein [Streptomyces sp. UNOC14_S4]|uniref:hypothetical protein n=1 Tax=Streptomyces sp. UNOC14_S4 TaxID=2872340 RepID=UPI001E39BDE7|nr:hypothetical protein [Streptomyces sp. UNOC14_S4]MCC3769454.1 hypothetical protein [Streptomyces sp. UNOC14_S4]